MVLILFILAMLIFFLFKAIAEAVRDELVWRAQRRERHRVWAEERAADARAG